ncbi:DUF1850 domain-containing protein [Corynebacterium riegelii]|uniref:DUF1850 domain-containing protein n=1 Tax=Corynebacterium riegelii TaxID=156976 RepID=UPI000C765295|nr:DUF1850 domain-containing protein [Corynebacterium riegelii]PLA13080.1 hypothetical protein CYJ48_06330 [Corynebacterium riegelii]
MASFRRSVFAAVTALVVVIAALALLGTQLREPHLVVSDQKSGATLFDAPVAEVSSMELAWIHSIEKTPWRERYEIGRDGLQLTDVYLKSYGAGAPTDIGGTTTVENGEVHIADLHHQYKEVTWVHSQATHHTLTVSYTDARAPFVLTDDLPERVFLKATVERR